MSNKCSFKKCDNDIGEGSVTVGFGALCPECTKKHKIFMDKWAEESIREFDMQTVRIIERIIKDNE